jgi:hypothetical protein
VLAESSVFLTGMNSRSVEQAKALANFNFGLVLRAEQLPLDTLLALGKQPNLCLAPNFEVIQIQD